MVHFIGVDVGTGSVRAGVFDETGSLLGTGRREIRIWREAGSQVEQSSEDIWNAVCAAVRDGIRVSGVAAESVVGIGMDATCSLVLLDAAGGAVAAGPSGDDARNVIVWMDHRAREQAARINRLGHEVLNYVGGQISPEMETPKILWLAENLPDSFRRARHFLDLADFLSHRATGSLARSTCTAACKWTYLAHAGGWQADYFRKIGLGQLVDEGFVRIGTEVVAPGTPLGSGLTAAAADELGLPPGTIVAAGLIDAHAGALGTIGPVGDGAGIGRRLAYVFGTSACTISVTDEPVFVPGVWGPYFSALLPGHWLNEGGQSAAGAAIDALLAMHPLGHTMSETGGALAGVADAVADEIGALDRFEDLTRGLHIVPEFLGNRAPAADPEARAVVSGLGLDADKDSFVGLYLAGLASLGYGLGQIVSSLDAKGVRSDLIVISGGAGASAIVRQVLADATGLPVALPETTEPVLLGSAILGAVASGVYPDLQAAAAAMSSFAGITHPDPRRRPYHTQRAEVFAEMQVFQRLTRKK